VKIRSNAFHYKIRNWLARNIFEFARFNFVGITITGVAYLVYTLLVSINIDYRIALAADYTLGIILSFFLNKTFTFRVSTKIDLSMIGRMLLSYIVIMAINFVLLEIIVSRLSSSKIVLILGQLSILVVIAVVSYLAQKMFVFRKR
jgi:putative flippase GtrA